MNPLSINNTVLDSLHWTDWIPHEDGWLGDCLPAFPGLYRIRRQGHTDLQYIGQTGSGTIHLRARLRMLRGIYAPEMTYRAPHTGGPALWALRHRTGEPFEVAVAPIEGDTPWREGMEAVAMAFYRQEHGASPTVEFGRVPVGYGPSSDNNARLVTAGKRFRGGSSDEAHQSHVAGIPPAGPRDGDPVAASWGGHSWSAWVPLDQATSLRSARESGLHRIRRKSTWGHLRPRCRVEHVAANARASIAMRGRSA